MSKRKLKYLKHRVTDGVTYTYFRDRAGRLTRLPGEQGSVEFQRAYDLCMQAMNGDAAAPARDPKLGHLPDSLAAAIAIYLASPKFAGLASTTKSRIMRHCEALRDRLGPGRLRDLDIDVIDIYTEELAAQSKDGKGGASVADRHVHVLSSIWKTVRKYPQFAIKKLPNPTIDAERRYSVQQRHRPWTRDVQDQFVQSAPDNLKLAKLLLHFSAQRGGDCVKMRWSDYDGKGLSVRQEKLGGDREALADYYLCPKPLREALDRAPRSADTILTNAYGKPFANASVLSKAIKRHLVRLGLAKRGERSFVMHGLRKTAASEVGSFGVGAAGIKSVTGHRTDQEANYYAQDADRRRINRIVVEQWDAEIARQDAERAATARRAKIRRVV